MQQAQLALQQQAQASLEKQRADDLAFRTREQAADETHRTKMFDLAELRRREEANVRGLELMEKDRAQMDRETALSALPPRLKQIVNLRQLGVTGISPQDFDTPQEREARLREEEQSKIRVARASRAPEKPDMQWVLRGDAPLEVPVGRSQQGDVPTTASAIQSAKEKQAALERQDDTIQKFRGDILNVIDQILDKDGELRPNVAGVVGTYAGMIPESIWFGAENQKGLAAINRLQGLLNIEKMGELKQQSPTGATGFGQFTERELDMLESAAATIRNRAQGAEAFAEEMRRLRDEMLEGRARVNNRRVNSGITVNPASLPPSAYAEADALMLEARKPKPRR
jgi:hypothetical protein